MHNTSLNVNFEMMGNPPPFFTSIEIRWNQTQIEKCYMFQSRCNQFQSIFRMKRKMLQFKFNRYKHTQENFLFEREDVQPDCRFKPPSYRFITTYQYNFQGRADSSFLQMSGNCRKVPSPQYDVRVDVRFTTHC